jgi:membrane-associated phospholipid phosphatase
MRASHGPSRNDGFIGGRSLFLVCAALCVVCYYYVDRPVARFAAGDVDVHHWLMRACQAMASPSLLSLPFGVAYLAALAVRTSQGLPAWPAQALLTQVSVAILAATAAKDLLKWAFGRPWPAQYLDYGSYQFSLFSNGVQYGCFPSGHTAYISAPRLVIAYAKPQWRWPCYAVIGMVMLGLIGGGYHFPGDTIAGLLTGALAARGTLALMRGKEG